MKIDLTKLSNSDLEKVKFKINNRPIKILDWQTSHEVMMGK